MKRLRRPPSVRWPKSSRGTRAWIRAYSIAADLGYCIRDCRIFAMAYEQGYTNALRRRRETRPPAYKPGTEGWALGPI